MRSKFTKQQKFDMVMECRNSGLSDYMWCKKHDIQSSTFYSWVKQLKRDGANVPERTYAEDYHLDSKPDIVKLLPAISKMISHIASSFTDIYSGTRGNCIIY